MRGIPNGRREWRGPPRENVSFEQSLRERLCKLLFATGMWCPVGNMSGLYTGGIGGGGAAEVISGLNFKLGVVFDRDETIPATVFSADPARRVL
jgi:hypothetical protein